MNETFVAQIPNYSLIGDLPVSKEDFKLLASVITVLYENNVSQQIFDRYRESLAVFLVFCAVYEYDNRKFWEPIEKYTGFLSYNKRMDLYYAFSSVVDKYKLNNFENESDEGFTYVTPILCHAGIPINAYDSYFAAISNTVNDTFYDDFDVDDFLYYLRNKTEMPVKRYIKLSNKRDSYHFIQNTRKLILSDFVDSDEELENGNYLRMLENVSFWKEKPKNKKSIQARSNVQLTGPKIKIDLDGVGIYCELPRIIAKDCYDPFIMWEISCDENTNSVKADFFKRSGVLVSEEKIVTIRPANTYTISLKVDDNQISKWEFNGVIDNYMAFSHNGNVIKTDALPNESVILLLDSNIRINGIEALPMIELPRIPTWPSYNIYRVDLSNVKVLECTGLTIRVNTENKPIISGGETLFNQENTRAYIKLPYIKVPMLAEGGWHLEIKHKSSTSVISKSNHLIPLKDDVILLSSYISNDGYGEYDIKLSSRSGMNGRFIIEYVPYGSYQVDKYEYWPSQYKGYENTIQTLRTSKNVELEIYNAEKISEIMHEKYIEHRFKVTDKDRFLIGEYRYTFNEHIFSTSIKKSIYPVSWGIIGLENEIIQFSSKVYNLTPLDLRISTDPYLLIAFDFGGYYDIPNLKVDLIGPDKEVFLSNTLSIKNKDRMRIPLNSHLFEIQQSSSEIDYQIQLTLIGSNDEIVSNFMVARFQDEVVIKNSLHTQDDNGIYIKWDEKGTRYGREIVLFNFLKPWMNPYHIIIEDKTNEKHIDTTGMEDGVYKYLIQKESDDLFSGEDQAEVCSLRDFQKRKIEIKGERKFTSDMERILYQILRSRFMKKELIPKRLSKIDSEIRSIQKRVPEDINYLAHAYILHDRFFSEEEDASRINELFTSLFESFSGDGKETMKYILESKFTKKYKKELLHKFHCNNLTSTTRLNEHLLMLLADIDEDMAGFIHLVESDNKSWGFNWAGISGIEVLKEEDLFGDDNSDTTILSDKNLGKSTYIADYFQYVSNCLQRPKNMMKNSADFLREFQREHTVQETKIFGKTRLQLLAEWRDHSRVSMQIQEKLAFVIDIPCDRGLKEQFSDAFLAIAKRRNDDELGYYIGLIALYSSFIRNGLMRDRKEFSRLLHYTIKKCGKLYYRDAIIIELYMRIERGFTWV